MKLEYKNYKGKRRIREIEPRAIEWGRTPHRDDDQWLLVAYDPDDQTDKKFVMENIQRFCPPGKIQRIMCVTTYVVNDDHEFLLMFHKKLNQWVPPGGKIENDETPGEAALRETLEETGLEVELITNAQTPSNLPVPYGVQLNPIKRGEVDHIDFIYFARSRGISIACDDSEATQARWFSLDQINQLETFESVKKWCLYFHNALKVS